LARVRILLDYRPALRDRTGVGHFAHHLAESLVGCLGPADTLTLFSSSWKDRLAPGTVPGALVADCRLPVRVLNFAWHRLEWPPVDLLAGSPDVTHSLHPLVMPSRRAASIVTIHDLYFLDRPADTEREIRRDYASRVVEHARRADAIVVPSRHTAAEVSARLQVEAGRIVVCSPGAPPWSPRVEPAPGGPLLFVGTAEPRKNVEGLLRAYERLLASGRVVPDLVIAGKVPDDSPIPALTAARPQLARRVQFRGYVTDEQRLELYRSASVLVMPSLDEGFGVPALEAMTIGLPVIAAMRGALPEVVGDAAILVDPSSDEGVAAALDRVLSEESLRRRLTAAGIARARTFQWEPAARRVYAAYREAVERRRSAA
jgi:glycosyltransferase involved in cell wall biosynthesis